MQPVNKALQKKFSLVPFSQEVKRKNSDYQSDENFEPYETSNHFTKPKV